MSFLDWKASYSFDILIYSFAVVDQGSMYDDTIDNLGASKRTLLFFLLVIGFWKEEQIYLLLGFVTHVSKLLIHFGCHFFSGPNHSCRYSLLWECHTLYAPSFPLMAPGLGDRCLTMCHDKKFLDLFSFSSRFFPSVFPQ